MSTYYIIVAAVLYGFGCVVCVFAQDPQDTFEGAIAIYTSVLWPLFALGWLVSRR